MKRNRLLFYCLFLLSAIIPALFGLDMYLKKEVVQKTDAVRFKDFIQNSRELGAASWLEKEIILPSRPALIPKKQILQELQTQTRFQDSLILVGGRVVYIPWHFQRDTIPFLIQLLSFLNGYYRDADARIEVEFTEGLSALNLGDGTYSFQAAQYPQAGPLTVGFERDGQKEAVRLEITLFYPRAVATRVLKKGDILREGDFSLEYRAEHYSPEMGVGSTDKLPGKEAKRTIYKGQLIRPSDVDNADIIRPGMPVTVTFRRGTIVLKLRGVAYGRGSVGERVYVKPYASSKKFMSRILSPGEVYAENF